MADGALELHHVDWLAHKAFSTDFAAAALERFEDREKRLKNSKLHQLMQASWAAYYQRDMEAGGACLVFKGAKGEVVKLTPALYRQKIQNRLSMVVQTPLDVEAVAKTTDAEAQAQCRLGLGIIQHYLRTCHLEDMRIERFEMASVLSESYLHVRWDVHIGDEVMAGRDGKSTIYAGDFAFSVRSPYDVWSDASSPDIRRPRAWIVREPMNRFDAMALYGTDSKGKVGGKAVRDVAIAIDEAEPYSSCMEDWKYDKAEAELTAHDDAIAVYYVYAERSAALPDGRFAIVLDEDTVLFDGPLGESRAGVFPLIPSRVMFRPEGHSNHFGGLAVAEAHAGEISSILSNHAGFGLARVGIPRESKLSANDVMLGLGAFLYNGYTEDGKPLPMPAIMGGLQAADLTFVGALSSLQDQIQGDAPVLRGESNASDSGAKTAALYSAAQQVAAPDIRADIRSLEEVFTFMLQVLQKHATTERIVMLAGENQRFTAERFTAERLKQLDRFSIRQPNPARDTFGGRMQVVEALNGAKDEEQRKRIVAVLSTGRIETVTDPAEEIRIMIERENAMLRDPNAEMPPVLKTDQHAEHIKHHAADLNNDNCRYDPVIRERHETHLAEHIGRLTPMHTSYAGDDVLMATGQKPLAPLMAPQGTGGQQGATQPGPMAKPGEKPEQGQPPKPPNGKPGAPEQPGQAAQMPKDPINGGRMEGQGPPPPAGA